MSMPRSNFVSVQYLGVYMNVLVAFVQALRMFNL
jgi:hypothetical protein